MSTENVCPSLAQIAFSVVDLRRTEAWFVEGLGFLPAGGNTLLMSGPIAGRVQGLPRAASCAWWLVGRNAWFQIELFQFRRPVSKLMPPDYRPCDTGYTRMGVHVNDFDMTLAKLARLGTEPMTPPMGEPGQRRACVRNPDGVYIELMEHDPLPQAAGSERETSPVAVRSVTMSTPDLEASVAYLTAVNGKGPEDIQLHTAEHETLWNLSGASCKRAVFRSGDILVELVQYLDPIGKPWPPGYRICDQGLLNIAYGLRNKADHRRVYDRTLSSGAQGNWRPFHFDNAGIVYMSDALGFSVEILWMKPGRKDVQYGFEPAKDRDQRPQHDKLLVSGSVIINAPVERVWQVLVDQGSMSHWIGFDTVNRTKNGFDSPDGVGSERLMTGKPGWVLEQITGIESGRYIRYRVIEGGPLRHHNGEIQLDTADGGSEVRWSIRFGCNYPLIGGLLRMYMQNMLDQMLNEGLAPYCEQDSAAA